MTSSKEWQVATLQVRDIDERLYRSLRTLADREHRSISQEVVKILESHVQGPNRHMEDATTAFLALGGSWQDERSANAIVKEIRHRRKNSRRYGGKNVVLD
jgi:plasmid stability protein